MRILELFCGTKTLSNEFERRGHQAVTLDIDPQFEPTICADILDMDAMTLDKYGLFDFIWASIPCTCFSVASMGHHWTQPYKTPRTEEAKTGLRIAERTVTLIDLMAPPLGYIIENPRGLLRKFSFMPSDRRTITYCQYGEKRMKPTDLWGRFPDSFRARQMCKNGDPCHERAPRGAKTGTQGIKGAIARSAIPQQLAEDVATAVEQSWESYYLCQPNSTISNPNSPESSAPTPA